jgi:hypothetical protein
MRALLPIAEAFILAAAAPAVVFAVWAMSAKIFVPAFLIALAHALLLGVPLFALLRWKKWVNPITTVFGAFVVGCIPIAIWSWPLRYPELKTTASNSTWGQTMIDGVPTTAGWLSYASGVLTFGGFGIVAGVVFWFYLRIRANKSPNR